MNTIISTAAASIYMLCAVPVAVILFVIIWRAVQQVPMFSRSPVVITVCVTLLCMIGLYQTFVLPGDPETVASRDVRPLLLFVLIPYTALALAILCTLLLLFIRRLKGRHGHTYLRFDRANRRQCGDGLSKSAALKACNSLWRALTDLYERRQSGGSSSDLKRMQDDWPTKEHAK